MNYDQTTRAQSAHDCLTTAELHANVIGIEARRNVARLLQSVRGCLGTPASSAARIFCPLQRTLSIGLTQIRINKSLFYSFTAYTAHLLQQESHFKNCQNIYVDAIEQNALTR